jgi:MFS family permease
MTVSSISPAQHPLRVAVFRRLWIGSAVSQLGDQFYFVALPWIVLQLTGSALAMSTVLMAGAIPRGVLMLMGGAISDRFSPRRILIATAIARTLLVAAIGALLALHCLHMADLYALPSPCLRGRRICL